MKKVTFLLAAILVLGVSNIVKAQDGDTDKASHSFGVQINPTALVDIEGVTDFTLTPVVGTEAGAQPFSFEGVQNSAHWLNYTSVKDAKNQTRSITAELSYEGTTLPAGMSIVLTPVTPTSDGQGVKGSVAEAPIVLDQNAEAAQTVVSGIGSCYTGDGAGKGVNLIYSLQLNEDDFGTIEADTYAATVTYTISDK
ncbi:hypothetical protein [Draconibacterium orientale]|uniref:hypothetical protein n=1 Tax=Draconibacterium orientale TaxID=1168034 RepID=UPI0029C0475F|nr:hypothetical protein [Draconibacterium orientale]